MRRFLALLSVTFVLTALVVAPDASAQDKPRRGGVLTAFINTDPGRLDFQTESGGQLVWATAGIFSGLLQHDPDDPTAIIGDLAENWTVSTDGKVYTFRLRSGVKWHDGVPFTASDVKAGFDRILNPAFRSPRCGASLKPIVAGVDVIDPATVRFQLKFPATTFVTAMSSVWCRVPAKHILEKYGDMMRPEALIGTGPFKLKQYVRGNLIELERNPLYFDPALPYLDGVKTFILKDAAAQLTAAKTGRIMLSPVWPLLTKSQAEELKAARGDEVEISKVSINIIATVQMNLSKAPFNNPDIRRAVNLAIDRQELVAKGLDGAAVPCALLNPELSGEVALPLDEVRKMPGCRQPKDADIAEAARLVAKHYPQGVEFNASVRAWGDYVDRAQLVLAQLRRIGLRGKLQSLESAVGWANYAKGEFEFIATQDHGPESANPADIFSLLFSPQGGRNYTKWSDARATEFIDAGLREGSADKRKKVYWELQRYLLTLESPPLVVVGWPQGWFFKDKRVRNHRYPPSFYDDTTYTKVWLAQ
ncbi:MAG: ABC transporter substrate-binding protein [Candidatus Rokubacteria bacterium]|nr:ABC transporter substrate-binding protein [Candidatus Rokubacteria bacterium]